MGAKLINFQTETSTICNEIEDFIRDSIKKLKRAGAVIGLSGGLDSAVVAVLTVRSLGAEKTHLLYMPDRDSNSVHRAHAKKLAHHLGVPLHIKNISSMLTSAGTYRILGLGLVPGRKLRTSIVEIGREKLLKHNDERILFDRLEPVGNSWITKGNAYGMTKHRVRAALVYQFAELKNFLVIGAANRTELLTGTFCKWGIDHCADIMPVIHIYRTQLEAVAKYIGVPEYIRSKQSDPDLFPTKLDKGAFLGGFEIADHILLNLENEVSVKELYQAYDRVVVDRLHLLYTHSAHMRESPYHL